MFAMNKQVVNVVMNTNGTFSWWKQTKKDEYQGHSIPKTHLHDFHDQWDPYI